LKVARSHLQPATHFLTFNLLTFNLQLIFSPSTF
jgi:hypothetical protein